MDIKMRKKQAPRINWKRIKKIPKLFIVFWFLLGIFSLVFLGDLPRSPYHSLENLQVKEITVDSARITRTFNKFSTMRTICIMTTIGIMQTVLNPNYFPGRSQRSP